MVDGLHGAADHLVDQVREARGPVQSQPQHHPGGGGGHQVLHVSARPVGVVGDDGQVGPAGQPGQQDREGGDGHRERGDATRAAQRVEGVGRPPLQDQPRGATAPAGPGRAGVVERQAQVGRQIAEPVCPVGQFALVAARPGRLRGLFPGVVGALRHPFGQFGRAAADRRPVQLGQVAQQDRHRPAVDADVVDHEHQHPGVVARAQQAPRRPGAGGEVERRVGDGRALLLDPRGPARRIQAGQVDRPGEGDPQGDVPHPGHGVLPAPPQQAELLDGHRGGGHHRVPAPVFEFEAGEQFAFVAGERGEHVGAEGVARGVVPQPVAVPGQHDAVRGDVLQQLVHGGVGGHISPRTREGSSAVAARAWVMARTVGRW